jgi:hypothetical protein
MRVAMLVSTIKLTESEGSPAERADLRILTNCIDPESRHAGEIT